MWKIVLDFSASTRYSNKRCPLHRTPPALLPDPLPHRIGPPNPRPSASRKSSPSSSILATYGRHLAQTLEHRAVARGFATIARFFGTVALDTILAHIHRGLMRAIALERMLRLRAARGRDLRILAPRASRRREPPREDAPAARPDRGTGAAR